MYSHIASWNSICLLLTISAVHGYYTARLDYVSAYPQAPVERKIYTETPKCKGSKKYKEQLNIDSSQMKQGSYYDEVYSPIASWNSIRLFYAFNSSQVANHSN